MKMDEPTTCLVNTNQEYMYMILSRLLMDANTFTQTEFRQSNLWSVTCEQHITDMRYIWDHLEIKPEWLTEDELSQLFDDMRKQDSLDKFIMPDYECEASEYASYPSYD